MLLFQSDWDLYPNAIVDTKTKNKSFLRIAMLYKAMGVKNHSFPLALLNPDLQGVDPYNPNITIEEITAIAIECKQNFMYYVREIARAPGGSEDDPILFRANRGNMALYWLFFNHITTILIQIRQTGKSFSTDILMRYLLNIRCTKTEINLLTKDDTLRSSNLTRLKNIELEIPFYLRQKRRDDIANTEELTIKSLGNIYRGHLPNKSPKLAYNVGRGLTSPIFHGDELCYLHNIDISLPAALASGTAAREIAERKNEPYGIILTTTVGQKDSKEGKFVYNLANDSAIWTESFLDSANREELYKLVRQNSPTRELRVNCTFSHRQLGYTDEWLKEAISTSLAKGEDAEKDFLNRWSSGSSSSPFTKEISEQIRNSQIDDFNTEISSPYGYVTRWYISINQIENKLASSHFILAVDSSDAVGGDDIALSLRDIKTGEVVAAGNYNETNLITFSEWLVSWLVRSKNITLIIERRSTGAMILDYLLLILPSKGIDPFTRIYNKVVQDHEEYPDRFKEINRNMGLRSNDIYVKYKKLFGFATSAIGATSRTELFSTTLNSACKYTSDKIKDAKTINQLLGLEIRNGRVDHPEGEHDDLVIAWLLSYWLISSGKKLDFYGIDSRLILCDNISSKKDNNPQLLYNKRQQDIAKQQIETLVEEIKKEKDDFIIIKLESQLKRLADTLSNDEKAKMSIDDLINSLREQRTFNRNKKRLSYYY